MCPERPSSLPIHDKPCPRLAAGLMLLSATLTGCGGGGASQPAPTFTVGGTVSGLIAGTNVVLADSAAGSVTVTSNGPFIVGSKVTNGSGYAVTVASNPAGETCTVTNGSGTVAGGNIANIAVTCTANTHTISAHVFGLPANSTLVLQDNGGDNLTVSIGGTFAFKTPLPSQSAYAVTIATQPAPQSCFVTGGTGTVAAANITVTVVCPWHVMYVPDIADDAVLAYYIDPTTGTLLSLAGNAPGAPAGLSAPAAIAATPSHKYLYVANQGSNSIAGFAIDAVTGALTPVAGSPFTAGSAPRNVVIDSTGQYLYVANLGMPLANGTADPSNPSSISAFAINQSTGALTSVAGSPYTTATSPSPIVADPVGDFLFAATGSYAIDPASGALTFINASTAMGCSNLLSAANGCAAAITSTGEYLYVTNEIFAVDPSTGVFTAVPGGQGANGSAQVISPNDQFLYFNAGGLIGVDAINATSGLASPIAGSPFQPAQLPVLGDTSYVVDPSGTLLYITTTEAGGIYGFSLNTTTGIPTPLADNPFTNITDPGVYGPGGYSVAIVPLL